MPLPLTANVVLCWDATSGVCRDVEANPSAAPRPSSAFRPKEPATAKRRARPYWTTGEIGLVPGISSQAIKWDQAAAGVTFSLAPTLLADPVRAVLSGASGELVWVPEPEQAKAPLPAVYPMLLVHTLAEALQAERVTIVPYLLPSDPLLQHIALMLQAAIEGKGIVGQLYSQSLADALVIHFFRRYGAARPLSEVSGGLSPYKLRNATAYIPEHLAQTISLTQLAAVGQTSPAHFARLFKHATGLAPHRYVIVRRMEEAKRLLSETEVSLSEIALQVGCADQSHFSALFRRHVGMTPKAYRDSTRTT